MIRPPQVMQAKNCATVERINGRRRKAVQRVALTRAPTRLALQDESQRAGSEEIRSLMHEGERRVACRSEHPMKSSTCCTCTFLLSHHSIIPSISSMSIPC